MYTSSGMFIRLCREKLTSLFASLQPSLPACGIAIKARRVKEQLCSGSGKAADDGVVIGDLGLQTYWLLVCDEQ